MHIHLQTERMTLRRLVGSDVDALVELDADPEVTRYVCLDEPHTRDYVLRRMLPRFTAYYDRYDGFGFWAAENRTTGEFLGWFHFRPCGAEPAAVDLGYRLRRAVWGRGLATEGARAIIRKGFVEQGVERIVAHALTANRASTRVMEKCEMALVEEYLYEGKHPAVKYGIDRMQYQP